MVWTKLIHCDLATAIKPMFKNGSWHKPIISGRYKAMVKKEFRIAGLPWLYEPPSTKMNPRDKAPKMKKQLKLKPVRLARIKQALKENEGNELKYRQDRLDSKYPKGFDLAIDTLIPYKLGALVYSKKVEKKVQGDIDAAFEVIPNLDPRYRLGIDDEVEDQKKLDAATDLIDEMNE